MGHNKNEAVSNTFSNHEVRQDDRLTLTCKDMRSLYPKSKRKGCQLPETHIEDLDSWRDVKKTQKQLQEKEEAIKIRIMAIMKECDTLFDGEDIVVTWKCKNRRIANIDRLKTEHPEIYKEFVTSKPTRYLVPHFEEVSNDS